MKKFSCKAQMSSPFELFVAVVIMTFVVIIGTQMLDVSQKQVCLASIDREVTKFVVNLEDSANNRTASRFEFRPDNCYNESQAIARIFRFDDAQICGAKCNIAGMSSCIVLIFHASDIPGGNIEKCIRIPPYTTFLQTNDSRCSTVGDDLNVYLPIFPVGDMGDNLVQGSYVIRNVSTAAEKFPSICMFRRR